MKKVYIMVAQAGTVVSKVIKLFTKSPYNHVSIGLDESLTYFWSFARKLRYFPIIGGFVREQLKEGIYKNHPETKCIIYSLEVDDETYDRVEALIDHYIKHRKEYHYNLAALFGGLIKRPYHFDKRHTCAEFVAVVLQESGAYQFSKPLPLTRPDEIMKIKGLQVLFEGKMIDFEYQPIY
jgi:hypothetical protein